MPKSADAQKLKFHSSDSKAIRTIVKKLVPLDFPLKFDVERSRQFTLGPMEFVLLFNSDLFRTSDFSHVREQRLILGVVAFATAAGTYTANRIIVLEPRSTGRLSMQVMSPKGQVQYSGEAEIAKGRLVGKMTVSLPGIPVEVRIEGDLSRSGDIRIAKPGVRLRVRSRAPEAGGEQER
jgi:hypothetical protein